MIKQSLFLVLTVVTFAHAASKDESHWNNVEIVIRGDYYRAASAAYADYSKLLMRRAQKSAAAVATDDRNLAAYLSNIEHFNIQVGLGHGRYQVWILPRTSDDFPVIFGSDALYVIDANSFEVLERHYGK